VRTRNISTATVLAVLFGSAALVAGTAGPATADTTKDIPISSYGDTAVDGVHQRLFVSDGRTGQILVTDYAGTVISTISGLPGVKDLVLSADSGTLYAAVTGADEIVSVDTGQLTVATAYPTGEGTGPYQLALAGGKLWFGYGIGWNSDLGSLDLSGVTPAVALDQSAGADWYTPPALYGDPAVPGSLVAVDSGISSAPIVVYDVTSDTPAIRVSAEKNGFIQDLDFTPDGSDIVVSGPGNTALTEYRLSDLGQVRTYPVPSPNGVAIAPDGTVAGESTDDSGQLRVFSGGADQPASVRTLGNPAPWMPRGALSWSPDGTRLFAVTRTASGEAYQLRTFAAPRTYVTTATVTAPAGATRAQPLTVSGTLTANLTPPAGTPLSVTRTDLESPAGKALAPVKLAADGAFSFTDTPYVGGTVTYKVAYAGDATYTAASASAKVNVSRVATTLVLNRNSTHYAYGSYVPFTAYLGTTYKNRVVEIWSDPWGTDRPKTLVKRGTVDSHGNLSATIGLTRNTTVTAYFSGDAIHAPKTVKSTVYVRVKVFTSLSRYYKTGTIGTVPYYFFNKNTSPLVTTSMVYYPGRTQLVQLQVYYRGTWYETASEYFALDTNGKSVISLGAPGEAGIQARVRSSYVHGSSGDILNDTTHSAWQYFYFTN
jgi:hypothetical protein